MTRVALQAQKRFLDLEHVRKYRPVWRVAYSAVIRCAGVLPGEGSDEMSVAFQAQALFIQRHQAPG